MINGEILKNAIISGAHNISVQKNHINDLNIFPVPDGDTGTNMSMTVMAAAKALEDYDGETAGEVADIAAKAMLRGARGNSGVITSILFRGFAQGLKDVEEVNGKNIAAALGIGVEAAYKAVAKPTEGTILTVARMAYEAGLEDLTRTATLSLCGRRSLTRQTKRSPSHPSCCLFSKRQAWWTPAARACAPFLRVCSAASRTA